MTDQKGKSKQDKSGPRHRGVLGLLGGRRLLIIVIFAVVVLAVVALLGSMRTPGSATSDKSLSTFTVRRDNLTVKVTESGSIKARKSIDIKCEVEASMAGREGGVTIISIVPEGSYITQEDVNAGKVLVELDSSNLTEQIALRKIDFAGAEASYADANESYSIQLKQNESDIRKDELAVKFASMDFQKYLGESVAQKVIEGVNRDPNANIDIESLLKDIEDPNSGSEASQKLRELSGAIGLAAANLEKATDTLKWTEMLYEKEYVAETELMKDKLDKQRLEIEKEKAEIALRLFKLYEFPKQVEQLLSDYEEAKRQLDRTHAQARSKQAQALALLKKAEAEFILRRDRLQKVEKQLVACTIRAPAPGLVVYSSSGEWWRRRDRGLIEEGGTVYEGQTIITLPNVTEMMAEINVHESSVDKVRPGQPAKITIDAFPDKTFKGEVLKVAQMPDSQRGWLSPDLKVYTTQVSIEGYHDFLKPLMSAKVEILAELLEDVIIVPVQVVANRQGKKLCYVMASNTPVPREVQTGSFNDTFVQIISGLEEGEEVLLNPPRLVEPGAADKLKRSQEGPQDRQSPESREAPQDASQVQGGRPPQSERPQQGGRAPEDRKSPEGRGPSQGTRPPQSRTKPREGG